MKKPRMKTVNGQKYVRKDGVWMLAVEGPSTREHSWITRDQILYEYPEFLDKIAEILFDDYKDNMKDYARNILTWLDNWKFVSWKQFDSIFMICHTYDDYKRSLRGTVRVVEDMGLVSVKSGPVTYTYRGKAEPGDWNDRRIDMLHKKLFGMEPMFEECMEYGMNVKYRNDGSRYFALPTGDEQLSDFVHFGINFKGLCI